MTASLSAFTTAVSVLSKSSIFSTSVSRPQRRAIVRRCGLRWRLLVAGWARLAGSVTRRSVANASLSNSSRFAKGRVQRHPVVWGTTSFGDELTDDFGGAVAVRLSRRSAGNYPHGVLGLLQLIRGLSRSFLLNQSIAGFGPDRLHAGYILLLISVLSPCPAGRRRSRFLAKDCCHRRGLNGHNRRALRLFTGPWLAKRRQIWPEFCR